MKTDKEIATLGAGCFWCTEAIFNEIKGVEKVESGFSGGRASNPSYEDVCTGKTGHAEAVQVTFDPKIISFEEIMKIFFTAHDPTTMNRQGADVGEQYRSVIFYRSEKQRKTAEQVVKELESQKIWGKPIVTQIVPFKAFYKAEDYHQNYYKKNRYHPYCLLIINPKLRKFRESFEGKLKK